MDLDSLKGKTIDDTLLDALKKHVGTFSDRAETAEEKARKAVRESIDGRKGKDAALAKALEKLGVDSVEDLESMPSAKGQAELAQQAEARAKRLERELGEKSKALEELGGKYSAERRERLLAAEVAKHGIRKELSSDVLALLSLRLQQEGEDVLFKTDDGKATTVPDGVAAFLKSRPEYVTPSGDVQRGSGYRSGATPPPANPWAPKTFNLTEQIRMQKDDPSAAAALKSAATAAQ